MTEKMDIRKPRLPSDVGWDDIEISDNKTQNLIWWNERNGRDPDKPTRKSAASRKSSRSEEDDPTLARRSGRLLVLRQGLIWGVVPLTREERINERKAAAGCRWSPFQNRRAATENWRTAGIASRRADLVTRLCGNCGGVHRDEHCRRKR